MKTKKLILLGIGIISALSLIFAYTAQYGFGILPCNLCLYQRVPYFVVIGLSAVGFFAPRAQNIFIALCAAAFAVNAGIAFYHVGVEYKWWVSALEGCKVTFDDTQTLEQMMKTPAVPCDTPTWFDPIFGMTMAFWNIIFSIFLTFLCGLSIKMTMKRSTK